MTGHETTEKIPLKNKIAIAAVLGALGFAGNYFSLPVAFSVAFIFGSIFSITATGMLGIWWGLGISLAASSYTLHLWNHPYALIIFAVEVLWIGVAIRRRGIHCVIMADMLYWLCLGWVLVVLFYGGVMGLHFQSVAIIIMKQAVNGIFNAFIASLILNFLPVTRLTGASSNRYGYRELLFHCLCGVLIIPMLSYMVYINYRETNAVQKRVAERVLGEALITTGEVDKWLQLHLNAVKTAADLGSRLQVAPSVTLQAELETLRTLLPAFSGIFLADPAAVTVAAQPAVNKKQQSNIGLNFADRDYYKTLTATGKPVVSDALLGRHSVFEPLIVLAYPHLKEGRLHDFAIGSISATSLMTILQHHAGQKDLIITLLDGKKNVIASSDKALTPLKQIPRTPGNLTAVTANVSLWSPGTQKYSGIMQAWKGARYVVSKPVPDTGWTLLVEYPVAPIQKQLYENVINGLGAILLLLMPTVLIATQVSKRLTQPLEGLAALSSNLPEKMAKNESVDWPYSRIVEIDSLTQNFRKASGAISDRMETLKGRMELAADSAGIGVWEWRVPENILLWDDWMYRLYGVKKEDFSGAYETWTAGLHPDDRVPGDEAIQLALSGVKEFDTEFRVVWPDGTIHHIKANAIVQRDESGNPSRMIGVNYDVTDQVRSMVLLGENQKFLDLILNSTAEAIYGIDLNGCCTFSNRACLHMLGYENQYEIAGRNMHDLIHHHYADGEHFDVNDCRIFRAFQKGEGSHVDDEVLWRRDGTSFPAEYWSYPQIENGAVIGAVVTFVDITERKLAEQEVVAARDAAEAASTAKSRFLANMSHEIRTPMNGIIGLSNLALQTEMSPRLHDYLTKITGSAESLMGVLNDILDFSKIEAGMLTVEKTGFSLTGVLEKVAGLYTVSAESKGLELLVSCPPDIPSVLNGDSLRLQQILANLVNNAIKFTEKGTVLISVEHAETDPEEGQASITFRVSDTGIGINPDQMESLFLPFIQSDDSTTRRYGGTGLGLSICNSLITLMGGQIAAESIPGTGSTFSFTLLFGVADHRQIPPCEEELAGMKTMAVDDNPIALNVMDEMLHRWDMRVTTSAVPSEALAAILREAAGSDPYRLLLLDWRMPGMDGLELVRRLRHELSGKTMPTVLITTAFGNEDLRREGEALGISAFISKPLFADAFHCSITQALHGVAASSDAIFHLPDFWVAARHLAGLHLLLAEDVPINAQLAVEIFEHVGVQVTVANNGREAVDAAIAANGGFDAVLMDIQMPVMDGYEATRLLRERWNGEQLPIVAMTAHAMTEERQRCLDAGMNGHVAKPINPDELFRAITNVTRRTGSTAPAPPIPPASFINLPGALPGLDIATALKRFMGDPRFMADIMSAFVRDNGDTAARLMTAAKNCNRDGLRNLAHTLKGVAGNVGAQQLHLACRQLEENMLADCPQGVITTGIAGIEELLREAFSSIAIITRMIDREVPPPAIPSSARPPAGIVADLRRALADLNFNAVELAKELATVLPPSPELDRLVRLAEGLDFSGAAGLLDSCAEQWK